MITKKFLKNVIPSMLAFAFSGIYVIIDGIFVGRNTGDLGLAAVNINYPVAALMQAVGTGIGMAGGIWISITRGRGETKKESQYLGNSFLLLFISSLLLMLPLLFYYQPLLHFLGAEGLLLKPSEDYLRIIIYGTVFQVMATGFVPLVRNYNGILRAMTAMILGLLANTILDYLFIEIYAWGTGGAAAATVLGQAVTLCYLLPFFFLPKPLFAWNDLIPQKKRIIKLVALARSPFGLTLIPNVIIILLNKSTLAYGGTLAVSAYAVISYVIYIVQLFLQGIGDGAQPLISRYYGASEYEKLNTVRRLSYFSSFVVGSLSCLALYLTRAILPIWFGSSPESADMYGKVLIYFLVGTIFASIARVSISYLYAINRSFKASLLIYGEPILLVILIVFLLPPFYGLDGVWLSVPISQLFILILSLLLMRKTASQKK